MAAAWERSTGRLLAREPAASDRDSYRRLLVHPGVERWLRPAPLAPFETAEIDGLLEEDRAHWAEHGFGPWALIDPVSGAFAGRGGLAWSLVDGRLAVELPWTVDPALQGRGLATEAALAAVDHARELGIEEVVALVLPANLASRRVAEKAGFTLAGECQHAGLPHLRFLLRL